MRKNVIITLVLLLFISACTSQPSAEETAQKLTILLNSKDYKGVYGLMMPDYRAQVSEKNFIIAMEDTQFDLTYIYEKIIVVEDTANAVIRFGKIIVEKDLPITLKKTKEGWKVDAFGGVITASCRVQGYNCKNSCSGETIEVMGAQCAAPQVCCKPIKIIECQKSDDCKERTRCNLETNKCEPIYTYIEITPWEIFLKYCNKVNTFSKTAFVDPLNIDEGMCRKAYNIIYNNGNSMVEMPVKVSSNCGGDLNFFAKGPAYFRDWGICKTGYLVYVESNTKEKIDVRALSLNNLDKIARIN